MPTRQLSWPLRSANNSTLPCEGDNTIQFATADHLEAQPIPEKFANVLTIDITPKLCDGDLDEQRFDQTLKPKPSISTLSSSCTTLCEPSPLHMEESSHHLRNSLPPQVGSEAYRRCRWRMWTPYRRLFAAVFLPNLVAMVFIIREIISSTTPEYSDTRTVLGDVLTAVSANLTASIAIRNEHVINMLFRVFVTHVTPKAPLALRRVFAKVYHFGGIHSGGGVSAVLWYGVYTLTTMHDFCRAGMPHAAYALVNIVLTCIIWILMVVLLTGAYPQIRSRLHNWFELSHRLCGWTILACFWGQTLAFCILHSNPSRAGAASSLVRLPVFWMLILMTLVVVYPWARIKNVEVRCEKLSDHAIRMHVANGGRSMEPCRVVSISHSPLKETHKFATIPEPNGVGGYSMVISNAGDWTAKIIKNPPTRIWIKGAPCWGVLRVATMFDPVVIVATGSGIGPCLGLFNGCPQLNCRVLWQARSPMTTYGKGIVDTVQRADQDAVIIDTATHGRQNMARLAARMYRECKAEAVIVISNLEGTYQVVRDLEGRGIPAFGPIWDS